MRSTTFQILFAFVLAACGGDGNGNGGPIDPGNGDDDIRGSYDAVHTFILNVGGFQDGIDCPGSLTITVLSAGEFSGLVSIGDCPEVDLGAASGPVSGTVSDAGAVVIPLDEEDLAALEDFVAGIGCVVISSEDAFTGTFDGDSITISFSADLDCEDIAQDVTFEWRVAATKIS
jgi:hypothetical protein